MERAELEYLKDLQQLGDKLRNQARTKYNKEFKQELPKLIADQETILRVPYV